MSNAPKTRSEEIRELYRQGIVMHSDMDYLLEINADLVAALERARPYVEKAYECAFPEPEENQSVLSDMDAAIARAKGQQ